MRRISRLPLKDRTLPQLARIALRGLGNDRSWQAVARLHMRGGPETLALASSLSRARSWRRRVLAMNIAAQLRRRVPGARWDSTEYALDETQALLLHGLHDAHDQVVAAAACGLGHRPHPDALADLVRLAAHADRDVRFDVAYALGSYDEPSALDALLALATDVEDDVRDWATFGLGSMHDADTPAIRERLALNLHDTDADVRGEALCGLAKRGDPRAVDYLVQHLDDECRVYELDAAEMLADPRLLEPLRGIEAGLDAEERDGYWFNCFQSAMTACASGAARDAD